MPLDQRTGKIMKSGNDWTWTKQTEIKKATVTMPAREIETWTGIRSRSTTNNTNTATRDAKTKNTVKETLTNRIIRSADGNITVKKSLRTNESTTVTIRVASIVEGWERELALARQGYGLN